MVRIHELVAALCLLLVICSVADQTASADVPTVLARLGYFRTIATEGDEVSNEYYTVSAHWQATMDVLSGGVVTSPRVEFRSSRTFSDLHPYPTSIEPGPTYVWDYPSGSLTYGGKPLFLDAREPVTLLRPGLTVTRSIDIPLLVADTDIQTVDFVVRFEEPPPAGVNNVFVGIGTPNWAQGIVREIVVLQNSVPGWSLSSGSGWGNAGWGAPAVTVGVEYHFQARIQCTKAPGYEGVNVYHKPQAFVTYANLYNPPNHMGTSTVLMHPLGEICDYEVAEQVDWQRMTTMDRLDVCLNTVSIALGGTGLRTDSIELTYGRTYDANGSLMGHGLSLNAAGGNIIGGALATPTGRTWYIAGDSDGSGLAGDLEAASLAELNTLGVVTGDYVVTLFGPAGETDTVTLHCTLQAPTQVPNILNPPDGAGLVPQDAVFEWDAVTDSLVDGIYLRAESQDESWESEQLLGRTEVSWPVGTMPAGARINGFLAFGKMDAGTTPGGIDWSVIGYTAREISFGVDPGYLPGDANLDDQVDLKDFVLLKQNFNTGATWGEGDFNMDGKVDLKDFVILKQNFGRKTTP